MQVSIATLRKHSSGTIDAGKNAGESVFYWFGDNLPYSWADDCEGGSSHTGWFTNDDGTTYKDGSGLARGVVVQLPPCPGFKDGRYLAGYWWGDNGEFVIWPDLFKTESEAARMADEHARVFAESAREDNARYEAMRNAEDTAEEKRESARLAIMARNVSLEHREMAREAIDDLRTALEILSEATEAYENA